MTDATGSSGGSVTVLGTPRARSSARAMIGRLLRASETPIDAARLAGLAAGFGPVASGWSILEVGRLRSRQDLDANRELPA